MHFLEGILVIILSCFLLISIIAVSQYLKQKFELLSDIDEDLIIELNVLEICDQEKNIKNLLDKVIEFLNSNGIEWLSIELFSEECGKTIVKNERILIEPEEQVKYIGILKITSEDILYLTIGVKK